MTDSSKISAPINLLTGLPRSGTTLCCHILNQHANTLALMEPMSPVDFNPSLGRQHAVTQVVDFGQSVREQVLTRGTAPSRVKDGSIPENPVAYNVSESGLRQLEVSLGVLDLSNKPLDETFVLTIKHNALFTALLPELQAALPVFAVVRNPLSVLASWNSVDLPVNQGRVPAGEMFDPILVDRLDATEDRVSRQLILLEWFCSQFRTYLPGNILKYEEFIVRPSLVVETLGLKSELNSTLPKRSSRNSAYDLQLMEALHKKLIGYGEAIWAIYTEDEVNQLMDSLF